VGRGPTLIEGLVGIALDAIASTAEMVFLDRARPNDKRLRACIRDLGKLPPVPSMTEKVGWGERFMFLDVVTMIDRHGVKCLEGLSVVGLPARADPRAERILEDIDWGPALRNANGWYDRLVAALREKSRADREKKLDQIELELKALKKKLVDGGSLAVLLAKGKKTPAQRGKVIGDLLITLLMPALRKVQAAVDRTRQTEANLSVAFALARYQHQHKRYPKSLNALMPKYLSQIPQDIFAGKPLHYFAKDKGYLLYSVGLNGKDEGGRGYDDMPAGDDLSVRMPLPQLQGK
jgi:hypothetical protein